MSRRSSCSISIFLIGIILTLILMLIGVTTASAKEQDVVTIRQTEVVNQFCILPDVYRAAEITGTNQGDWIQPDVHLLQYRGNNIVRLMPLKDQFVVDASGRFVVYPDTLEADRFWLFCTLSALFNFNPDAPGAPENCPSTIDEIFEFTGIPQEEWRFDKTEEYPIKFEVSDPYVSHPAYIKVIPQGVLIYLAYVDGYGLTHESYLTPGYTDVRVNDIVWINIGCID